MSTPEWEDVVEMPDELDDETAEALADGADEFQDMKGEMCPYPQVEAKKALSSLDHGDLLVQETDHVPSTENVPKAVEDEADAKVWRSGDGLYRIFLHKR
jgi:TusA-related sulfurtransferase